MITDEQALDTDGSSGEAETLTPSQTKKEPERSIVDLAGESADQSEPGGAATAGSLPSVTKAAPRAAKKRSKTRTAPRKSTPKKSQASRKNAALSAGQQAKFPRHAVEAALRIPKAIFDQNAGNPATPTEAVAYTGGSSLSGNFKVEISSARKYGFLESEGSKLKLTDRARRAIKPQSGNDRRDALREAVLGAPDLAEVYAYYRGSNLPDRTFLVNALTERFGIPADKVDEFLAIFNESLDSAELIDRSGSPALILDVGRDEGHKGRLSRQAGSMPVDVAPGATCFVMQPFSGALGGYYDLVFKPAIEQAGMVPVRADAEIFGTGKIIDQIWRGIHGATVLVAELTTKNPNVFYELGLAHALQKPVILVSSRLIRTMYLSIFATLGSSSTT